MKPQTPMLRKDLAFGFYLVLAPIGSYHFAALPSSIYIFFFKVQILYCMLWKHL